MNIINISGKWGRQFFSMGGGSEIQPQTIRAILNSTKHCISGVIDQLVVVPEHKNSIA